MATETDVTEDTDEMSPSMQRLLGVASAIMMVVAYTMVGFTAMDSVVYGATAGIVGGVGSLLFLPWWLDVASNGDDDDETGFWEAARDSGHSSQLGVVGLGLDLGGVVMFTAGFIVEPPNLLIGTSLAVICAGLTYAVAALLFDVSTASG